MTNRLGLGQPRGPHFVSQPLRLPPPRPTRPEADRPSEETDRTQAAGVTRREMIGVALLAAVAGSLGGGVAGLITSRDAPPEEQDLPRSSGGPVTGDLSDVAERVVDSVVSVYVPTAGGTASGSGFMIDRRGHVITNAHVVGSASRVQVVLPNGLRVTGEVIGRDLGTDIAVVRVGRGTGVPPLRLGRSADVAVGDQVLAVGSPLGLRGTVTAGIISAVNRQVRIGQVGRQSVLQTDTPINPGNSGGPLVNARGEAIGVNTAIASVDQNSGNIGIGFAIPIDRAARVAERIIRG